MPACCGQPWPFFWIGSALALWLVEHDAPGTNVATFPEAMTAAFTTAATLGFGKHGLPVTEDGQIISAGIVFLALGLWGFASSNLTHIWLKTQDQLPVEVRALGQEIEALRADVRRLTNAAHPDPMNVTEPHASALFPESDATPGC